MKGNINCRRTIKIFWIGAVDARVIGTKSAPKILRRSGRPPMQEYEIRVLGRTGRPSIVMVELQMTDEAAIQTAEKVAKSSQFEVWCGSERIFCSHPTRPTA
jgi:hypothetical protein